MKIRPGFVSNSSSSSFVILGVEASEGSTEYNHIKELFYTVPPGDEYDEDSSLYEWNLPGDIEYTYTGDCDNEYFGVFIAQGSDDFDFNEFELGDLNKLAQKISDTLELPVETVKLVVGSRCC